MKKQSKPVRWGMLVVAAAGGAGLTYFLGAVLLDSLLSPSPGVIPLLIAAYAALAAGYVFAASATRLAPARRYSVAVALVFVTVGVAVALMRRDSLAAGPLPAVLMGASLVVGAFGYALRVRGFTEAITGREA
jgi:hypothetical protein